MAVKYGKFEMPDKIKVEESGKTQHYARFVVEPFEKEGKLARAKLHE